MLTKEEIEKIAKQKYPEKWKHMDDDGWADENEAKRYAFIDRRIFINHFYISNFLRRNMNTTINFGETKEITFKAGTDTYTRKAEVTDFQYYDDNERLVKIESYDGTLNNYEYHSNGKMKSQELYQNGKLFFKNQFDENGNLVKTTNADGTTEELIVEKYSPNGTTKE